MAIINFFPLIVGLILIISGLTLLAFRSLPTLFLVKLSNFPIKLFGLFWLFLALGIGLSSYYELNSVIIYLITGLMIIDGLTLILIPKSLFRNSLLWTINKTGWYVFFYALYLLTMGTLLLVELIEAAPEVLLLFT